MVNCILTVHFVNGTEEKIYVNTPDLKDTNELVNSIFDKKFWTLMNVDGTFTTINTHNVTSVVASKY